MGETYLHRKLFSRVRSSFSSISSRNNARSTSSQLLESQSSSRESALSPAESTLMQPPGSSSVSTDQMSPNASLSADSPESMSNSNSSQKLGSRRAKLRSATRAIFFFRRAACSDNVARSQDHLADEPADRHKKLLVRQQTADSSNLNATNQQYPTQFIVPKTNALKLPLVCLIKSVEGELMREVFVHRYELGSYLIESLKVSFGVSDCKYFGLKIARTQDEQDDLRNPWLDMDVAVCKQVSKLGISINSSERGQRSIDFYLRIKFYPPSLTRVQEAFVRHYLWIQLRRDLRLGKLTSSMSNLTFLMACVLQFELSDHCPQALERVPQLQILPNQDLVEHEAVEIWRDRLQGSLKHQAQMQFLRAAVILETYGFDYYPVRDHQRQRAYLLGFNYAGVKTIRNGRIVHHFRWQSISKISNEKRMIIFHVSPTESSRRKQILGFKCLSSEDCQNLYLRLVEQKVFFTLDLAYFDKSMRSPPCLHESASEPVALAQLHSQNTSDTQECCQYLGELNGPEAAMQVEIDTVAALGDRQASCVATPTPAPEGTTHSEQAIQDEEPLEMQTSSSSLLGQLGQLVEQVANMPMAIRPATLRRPGTLWARLWRLSLLLLTARLLLGLADSISSWLIGLLSFAPEPSSGR